MSVVHRRADFAQTFAQTRAAARAVFGDDRLYVERYLTSARHVEVQFLCDAHGNGVHLGSRDCSVQRRYQKLVEEAPAPAITPEVLDNICTSAVAGALAAGFTGVGTMEFLLDEDERFSFMEVNSRIQVEHPVTEMVTGVDLVHEQLRVAGGEPLRLRQSDIVLSGVSVECRVNAEDPARGFAPTPGLLERFTPPGGPFVRVDTHGFAGYRVGPHYDSLLAKVVTWAPGREQALLRMERALAEFEVAGPGVAVTTPFLLRVLADPEFRAARHNTSLVGRLTDGPATSAGTATATGRAETVG